LEHKKKVKNVSMHQENDRKDKKNHQFWVLTYSLCREDATPLWDKCEDEIHTPKSGKLESSRTPKNLELEFKGQNTSH
jgi:hypothetical protein